MPLILDRCISKFEKSSPHTAIYVYVVCSLIASFGRLDFPSVASAPIHKHIRYGNGLKTFI